MKPFRYIFLAIFFIFSSLVGQEQELLEPQDVQKIMHQIFSQHLDKKQMSIPILKNSFKVYIDQFDPERMYLLDQEAQPYLSFSDEEIQKIMSQYSNNEFTEYTELNETIQNAIHRTREIRNELEKEKGEILQKSKSYYIDNGDEWNDPDLKRAFPKTLAELKDRVKQHIIRFIAEERRRYGEAQVQRYEAQMLNLYEKHIQHYENNYLFISDAGHPLLEADKQNLFILHVLKSLANSLDAHTTFYAPSEAYDMKVRLEKEFLGIGTILKQAPDGTYYISRLIPGSSAAKSGLIKVNDQIIEIDGKPLLHESYEQVSNLLRGKNGSKVFLTVRRTLDENYKQVEKTFNVTLTRAPIVVQEDRVDISYENFGNGIIGKVTLHAFYQSEDGISSEKDVRDAIKKLQKIGNLRGLILDLRENSGGFLSQAVKVAGLFITNGVVVISKYSSGEERFYRDMESNKIYDGPLIILTSKATASAAEIVAQALQDYGLALVVGDEHTYGKGTIQSQTVTGDQASAYFKVTIGKYYTVSGKTPQMQGVKADIVVPSQFTWENLGEEYLEYPLDQDKIPAAYQDTLSDIDPSLKPWYMRYYMPTIQHQKDLWQHMVPTLKKNSTYRIAHNKEYQLFLNRDNEKDRKRSYAYDTGVRRINAADLQMAEAVNVVKDMITLETRARSQNSVVNSKERAAKEQSAGITQDILK